MLVNFRKTLLEITYFKVIFKLKLLISNLASIYRLALIPVRLIMEGVLFEKALHQSNLTSIYRLVLIPVRLIMEGVLSKIN